MSRSLSLSLRPQSFAQMVGQAVVVESIRKQYQSKREPAAWLFLGPTGSGKTSLARILALSLNCTHAEFGQPCKDCRANRSSFSITEVNASEVSGVNEIGEMVQGANLVPLPPSRRRVYILDEAGRLSPAAQNLLLKYFEDAPVTTVWIVCTTESGKILETLRSRCQMRRMRPLNVDQIGQLVAMAYKAAQKKTDGMQDLVDALCEARVQLPRFILNICEAYFGGLSAKEAVREVTREGNTLALCRSLLKGDWVSVRKEIENADNDDLKGIRAQVGGYIKTVLLRSVPGPRANEAALAIEKLAQIDSFTDIVQGPATVSCLYRICSVFRGDFTDVE